MPIWKDGEVAIEVKVRSRLDKRELRPLIAFREEYSLKKAILVCNETEERKSGNIQIMPWWKFLDELWEGKII